jgi:hypothetical protein
MIDITFDHVALAMRSDLYVWFCGDEEQPPFDRFTYLLPNFCHVATPRYGLADEGRGARKCFIEIFVLHLFR